MACLPIPPRGQGFGAAKLAINEVIPQNCPKRFTKNNSRLCENDSAKHYILSNPTSV
jgi:hypothetical protein